MLEKIQAWNVNLIDVMSPASLIDIAIVAFVLYRLMLLIKGTRAVPLLKGLVVILVAAALSSVLNLHTLNWLLRQALTALVVALPIVFQPELRRALEKLGGGKLLGRSFNHLSETGIELNIDEVVRAVSAMSKNRVGALIIIEMGTGLEEYIDTGIKIGGKVSAEFLVNIFIPKTPLHDGAVIIRGDSVMAAACVLPLTEGQNLSKELGTRHRAGIGITEVSDSMAIIVSEETGTISLAAEGQLNRGLDEKSLGDIVAKALKSNRQQGSLLSLWHRR